MKKIMKLVVKPKIYSTSQKYEVRKVKFKPAIEQRIWLWVTFKKPSLQGNIKL